jgi:RNA polymerase sigma-70 factor (ECF subfamily)
LSTEREWGTRVLRDLVERAAHGDEQAFEALIGPEVHRLYAAASLILHDRTLAEDAVQETMLRAWRDLPGLRDPERFVVWLRRVLIHACIDLARAHRHARAELELSVEVGESGDIAVRLADRDAIVRAFAGLPPAHRAVIVLRHYLGHSVPEVAELLGIRLGTAKSRLSRAEAKLRTALEADGRLLPQGGAA